MIRKWMQRDVPPIDDLLTFMNMQLEPRVASMLEEVMKKDKRGRRCLRRAHRHMRVRRAFSRYGKR